VSVPRIANVVLVSSCGATREGALSFRDHLRKIKLTLAAETEWYPYDILANFIHLEQLLQGENASLLSDVKGWTIADIGAADGDTAFFMESLGAEHVDIIDYPPTNWNGVRGAAMMQKELSSRVEIHHVDLDSQFTLPRERYSLVFFLGILYHLKNPFYALEALAKASEYCLVSTRITRFAADRTTDISRIPVAYLVDPHETNNDATNFWIFSDAGLRRIIARSGWELKAFLAVGNTTNSDPASWEGDERAFCLLQSRQLAR